MKKPLAVDLLVLLAFIRAGELAHAQSWWADPRSDATRPAGGVSGPCEPSWQPTFGGQPGVDGWLNAMTVFDDGGGGGPALYLGGQFQYAGGGAANCVVKWDGTRWSALGSGVGLPLSDSVYALTVFDDGGGAGPALYAAGTFTIAGGLPASNVAKWDGTSWSPVGGGTNDLVFALTVFDDGTGPALYAGGGFTAAGGVAADRVAKWDGTSWTPVGTGVNDWVQALTVFDDGSVTGPALFAGGLFTTADGAAVDYVAKWDGASWTPVGIGTYGIRALAVHDDGSGAGPALYASGQGGGGANTLGKWTGTSWVPVGAGILGVVDAMTTFDDGSGDGPALHAGGSLIGPDGETDEHLARWDGTSWTLVPGLRGGSIHAFAVFDDGSGAGPALVAGGGIRTADGEGASGVASWNGASWSPLKTGNGLSFPVSSLAVFDDGNGGGPALHAAGIRQYDAPPPVVKWDGTSWTPLGSGMGDSVRALTVFDDGSGAALYAGGNFTTAGGVSANQVAKWDGASWAALAAGPAGVDNPVYDVSALAVFDDQTGGGPALYAGGNFWSAAGPQRIAKWDGTSWSSLQTGMNNGVRALAVFDDGSGPALYAGGRFTSAGSVTARRVARWDGTSWSALGIGIHGEDVNALAVFDDGSGNGAALYALGLFWRAGGVDANSIAKWDGTSWSPLGSGMRGSSLAVFDDGSGPALYAGGYGITAEWDGTSWSPLGGGMAGGFLSASVDALVFDDGSSGPALIAGGYFSAALDTGDSFVARWEGCIDTAPPTLSCPSSIVVRDPLSGGPGEFVHFSVTASDNRAPTPFVHCVPPSGSFFPQGTTLVTCTATDAAGNQSTCAFPVIVQPKIRRR